MNVLPSEFNTPPQKNIPDFALLVRQNLLQGGSPLDLSNKIPQLQEVEKELLNHSNSTLSVFTDNERESYLSIHDSINKIQSKPFSFSSPAAKKHILRILSSGLHITSEQVDFFSEWQEKLWQLPAETIIRMLAQAEAGIKIEELSFFNGKDALPLYDKFANNKVQNGDVPIPSIPPEPVDKSTFHNRKTDTPRYLVENHPRVGISKFSEVFRVWDTKLQNLVVAKRLHSKNEIDSAFVKSIDLEAQSLAKLTHPNIAEVYNLTWDKNENSYMIMPYLKGLSLAEQTDFTSEDLKEIAKQAASALDYISNLKKTNNEPSPLIHLDVKPGSMMWHKGHLTMYDLGISTWVDRYEHEEGAITGTPEYITPEQMVRDTVSNKSNIYQLAATMFNLVSGVKPVGRDSGKNNTMNTLINAALGIRNKLPARDQLFIHLSESGYEKLVGVLDKGMHVDPKMRYNTAGEFAAAFQAALELE